MLKRRKFMGMVSGAALGLTLSQKNVLAEGARIIKPPALKQGDTVGLDYAGILFI